MNRRSPPWSRKRSNAAITEPDLRDDLSGMDVARKAVIVGREMGLSLELADVTVESLVPPKLTDVADPDEFLHRLAEFDPAMKAARQGVGPRAGTACSATSRSSKPSNGASVGVRSYEP